ncbi:MAG: hypothetical protein RL321_545 [Pseudomonadota bacterium]
MKWIARYAVVGMGLALLALPAQAETVITECDRLAAHPEDPQKVTPGVHQNDIDYPKAIAACEQALQANPRDPRARYQLARVLFYTNQNERAVAEMKLAADAGHIQAQYIFATFIARSRPFAPTDICLAEQYWRQAATAGRQAARVQYVRFTLQKRFDGCATVASDAELRSFVDGIAKDSKSVYENLFVEDFNEGLKARPSEAARASWQRCRNSLGLTADEPWRVRRFGDTEAMTNALTALILSGEKTITATTPWAYGRDPERRPYEGAYAVLLNGNGEPAGVLRTTSIYTKPFNQVTAEDSRYEGKPVRPLEAWQKVHRDFFNRTLAPIGKAWSESMPVTLEKFEVVCR